MTVERGSFVYFLSYCATVFEILSTPTELTWLNVKLQHKWTFAVQNLIKMTTMATLDFVHTNNISDK